MLQKYYMRTSKFWGAPLAQGHAHFTWFLMGLGKPKLCVKFEVAIFSRCRNIKREPPNLGSSYSPGPCRLLCVWFYDGPLQTPEASKIWSRSPSGCRNIKGDPQILGSSPSPGAHPLFLLVEFHIGPWQTSVDFLFGITELFASSYGWDVISRYWSKSALFRGGWVTLTANFRW